MESKLRRGISTWDWPYFHDDPQHENTSQMERWSLNQAPTWTASPVAIANRHYNANDQLVQNTRYRLIPAKASNFDWLIRDKHAMRDLRSCQRRLGCLFFGRRPLPFGGSPLEAYSRTSGESNHHRQSVRVVKNDALPTEPRGHL